MTKRTRKLVADLSAEKQPLPLKLIRASMRLEEIMAELNVLLDAGVDHPRMRELSDEAGQCVATITEHVREEEQGGSDG
jgi:hypothetical protein